MVTSCLASGLLPTGLLAQTAYSDVSWEIDQVQGEADQIRIFTHTENGQRREYLRFDRKDFTDSAATRSARLIVDIDRPNSQTNGDPRHLKFRFDKAFFPGTKMQFDIVFEIYEEIAPASGGNKVWMVRLRVPSLGADGKAELNEWLKSKAVLPGRMRRSAGHIFTFDHNFGGIRIGDSGVLDLNIAGTNNPRPRLSIRSRYNNYLDIRGIPFEAEKISLTPMGADSTLIEVKHVDAPWFRSFKHWLPDGANLKGSRQPFSLFRILTDGSRNEQFLYALASGSRTEGAQLFPSEHICDLNGDKLGLPIAQIEMLWKSDGTEEKTIVGIAWENGTKVDMDVCGLPLRIKLGTRTWPDVEGFPAEHFKQKGHGDFRYIKVTAADGSVTESASAILSAKAEQTTLVFPAGRNAAAIGHLVPEASEAAGMRWRGLDMAHNVAKTNLIDIPTRDDQALEMSISEVEVDVRRPVDLLNLTVTLRNFTLRGQRSGGRASPAEARFYAVPHPAEGGDTPSSIAVDFPPQQISENAYYLTDEQAARPFAIPVSGTLAGRSRLAFVPRGAAVEEGVAASLEGFLNWRNWQQKVVPAAKTNFQTGAHTSDAGKRGKGVQPPEEISNLDAQFADWDAAPDDAGAFVKIERPKDDETAIELPRGLVLSPHKWAKWTHDIAVPAAPGDGGKDSRRLVPVWHTRMARYADSTTGRTRLTLSQVSAQSLRPDGSPLNAVDVRTAPQKIDRTDLMTVRAVYTASWVETEADGRHTRGNECVLPTDGRPLPSPADMRQIVNLSANFSLHAAASFLDRLDDLNAEEDPESETAKPFPYAPQGLDVKDLMLSPLGATSHVIGGFNPSLVYGKTRNQQNQEVINRNPPFTIEGYEDKHATGRQEKSVVKKKGYILPWGHEVTLVISAKRVLVPGVSAAGRGDTAIERKFYKCDVKTSDIDYPYPLDGEDFEGRKLPFKSITIENASTPNLAPPVDFVWGCVTEDPCAFWMVPSGAAEPYTFKLHGIDHLNIRHDFAMPLLWVSREVAERPGSRQNYPVDGCPVECAPVDFDDIVQRYHSMCADLRRVEIGGSRVTYAPLRAAEGAPATDDPSIPTRKMWFGVALLRRGAPRIARTGVAEGAIHIAPDGHVSLRFDDRRWPALQYFPIMERADVQLQAVADFADGSTGTAIRYNEYYQRLGFSSQTERFTDDRDIVNSGEVYLDVAASNLDFPGGKSGGLATPNINIAHLSRRIGPVGGQALAFAPLSEERCVPGNACAEDANFLGIVRPVAEQDIEAFRAGVAEVKRQYQANLMAAAASSSSVQQGFTTGKFDAGKFFDSVVSAAKLLGGVDLKDVVEPIEEIAEELSRIPQLIEEQLADFNAAYEQLNEIKTDVEKALAQLESVRRLLSGEGSIEDRLKAFINDEILESFETTVRLDGGANDLKELKIVPGNGTNPIWTNVIGFYMTIQEELGRENDVQLIQRINDSDNSNPAEDPFKAASRTNINAFREYAVYRNRKPADAGQVRIAATGDLTDKSNAFIRDALSIVDISRDFHIYGNAITDIGEIMLKAPFADILSNVKELVDIFGLFSDYRNILGEARRRLETLQNDIIANLDTPPEVRRRFLVSRARAEAESRLKSVQNDTRKRIREHGTGLTGKFAALYAEYRAQDGTLPAPGDPNLGAHIGRIGPAYGTYEAYMMMMLCRQHMQDVIDTKIVNEGALEQNNLTNLIFGTDQVTIKDVVDKNSALGEPLDLTYCPGIRAAYDTGGGDHVATIFEQDGSAHEIFYRLLMLYSGMDEAAQRLARGALQHYFDTFLDKIVSIMSGLGGIVDDIQSLLLEALKFVVKILNKAREIAGIIPKEVNLSYKWEPRLRDGPSGRPIFVARREGTPTKLIINSEIRKSTGWDPDRLTLDEQELKKLPQVKISGVMTDFSLQLIPPSNFFIVDFKELSFVSENLSKPDVKVKLAKVKLGQSLDFVQKLQSVFNPGSGLFFDVSFLGITAGYSFQLPAITTGAFNIYQLSVNTGVILPFDGSDVKARCSISTRSAPFLLTVGILGGGGFFAINVSSKGVDLLEGSMEYGAIAGFEIGVAKGLVSITAGVYFSVSRDEAILAGFFQATGSLDVAGLITITATFYLGLSYEKRGGQSYVVGEARITVTIEFTFFDVSYELTCRKEYQGSRQQNAAFLPSSTDAGPGETTADGFVPYLARDNRIGPDNSGSVANRVYTDEEWQRHRRRFLWGGMAFKS